MNKTELIALWDSDEGKPYKGRLIDWDEYTNEPESIGCMCAQGQVLHKIGGYTAQELKELNQSKADKETARLLNISLAHAVLLRNINDSTDGAPSIVLTDPQKVLGDQADKVLGFMLYLDNCAAEAWDWGLAEARAGARARDAAGAGAGAGAGDAAGALALSWAGAGAANEIQGAKIMREKGQEFYFLPMFGFDTPEDIPPLPDNYGDTSE